jgi:hypothetical protein
MAHSRNLGTDFELMVGKAAAERQIILSDFGALCVGEVDLADKYGYREREN